MIKSTISNKKSNPENKKLDTAPIKTKTWSIKSKLYIQKFKTPKERSNKLRMKSKINKVFLKNWTKTKKILKKREVNYSTAMHKNPTRSKGKYNSFKTWQMTLQKKIENLSNFQRNSPSSRIRKTKYLFKLS